MLGVQSRLPVFPSSFCLVTGAPRSGTSAIASWIGKQFRVRGFSESKILFAAHQLRQSLLSWERFPEDKINRMVRRFVENYYAEAGWCLGAKLLFDKEPLDPMSLPSGDYSSFLDTVEKTFPTVRFVFMVRNPESVVSSIINREWGYSVRGIDPKGRGVKEAVETWVSANHTTAKVSGNENVYVCQFEELVENPGLESKKLSEFLGIAKWRDFKPKETSEVSLNSGQRRQIRAKTEECRQELARNGIEYNSISYG